MWDVIRTALESLQAGKITPATFAAVCVFALIAWLAGKAGQKALESVRWLLTEGERLRATLQSQLDETLARGAVLQQQRDEALTELSQVREELATTRARYEALELRMADLQRQLLHASEEIAALRLQLASRGAA